MKYWYKYTFKKIVFVLLTIHYFSPKSFYYYIFKIFLILIGDGRDKFGLVSQKSKLEQYLKEYKIDRKSDLDILTFWKSN